MDKIFGVILTLPLLFTIVYILVDGLRKMGNREGIKFLAGLVFFVLMWWAFMQGLTILAK